MSQAARAKETIILVHGTWAAPTATTQHWYRPIEEADTKQSFVAKLDAALERIGSPARCWAHCRQPAHTSTTKRWVPFHWTGENNWLARSGAAGQLAREIDNLTDEGWRCHVIAHSHGGNILLEALRALFGANSDESVDRGLGKAVTLGTPFMDTLSSVRRQRLVWEILFSIPALLVVLGVLLFIPIAVYVPGSPYFAASLAWWQHMLLWLVVCLFLPPISVVFGGALNSLRSDISWRKLARRRAFSKLLLVVGSPYDEACRLLHHLVRAANPFDPETGIIGYLAKFWWNYARRQWEIDKLVFSNEGRGGRVSELTVRIVAYVFFYVPLTVYLLNAAALQSTLIIFTQLGPEFKSFGMLSDHRVAGAVVIASVIYAAVAFIMSAVGFYARPPVFIAAVTHPVRVILRHVRILALLPKEVVTYLVRKQGLSVLQSVALGLEAYRFQLPNVDGKPLFLTNESFSYEDLPTRTVERISGKRNDMIGAHIDMVSTLLAKDEIATGDLSALLREVETNLSLVHAAYYTDDECIERIARWIAGKGGVEGAAQG